MPEKYKLYDTLSVKHRPFSLNQMVGQDIVVDQIKGMFRSHKVLRSLLISGSHGSGKTSLALIIARYANCQNKKLLVCKRKDLCSSCAFFTETIISHPDVQYINVGDETGVDKMRAIISSSKFMPSYVHRVYILDEFHQASKAAGSALLIPLETPPANTIFILCTSNPEKLLPTIYSRCIHFKIREVSEEKTAQLVSKIARKEDIKLTSKQAFAISQSVAGHPRDALSVLESLSCGSGSRSGDLDKAVSRALESTNLIVKKLWTQHPGHKKLVILIDKIDNYEFFLRQSIRFVTKQYVVGGKDTQLRILSVLNQTMQDLKLYTNDPYSLLIERLSICRQIAEKK